MSIFKAQPQLRLNSLNYMCWKNLIRPAPQKAEAYKIATGEEVFPEGTTNQIKDKQRDYDRRAATGLDVILAACAPSIAVQIGNIDNLPELWESLKARYHQRLRRRAYDNQKQLRQVYPRGG